jgi:hypothetical protein
MGVDYTRYGTAPPNIAMEPTAPTKTGTRRGCNEPIHVHVRRDRHHCKFWLAPVELAWNHGFSSRELNEIRRIVVEHEQMIVEAWNEHCRQH